MRTIDRLNEARETMHELITGSGTWEQRYHQQKLISDLQQQLAMERQVNLNLMLQIFPSA